ncbi:hypothetical protein E2C01_008578 [Portunus trituberculatus]|uniref:Uncharacterized protein n=1 Tax=Portunus trituberculatus TaxID=210409 RepID=A0A5B7D379_PORTR|nr:hypothetical protein [Portunus trituberculatus]
MSCRPPVPWSLIVSPAAAGDRMIDPDRPQVHQEHHHVTCSPPPAYPAITSSPSLCPCLLTSLSPPHPFFLAPSTLISHLHLTLTSSVPTPYIFPPPPTPPSLSSFLPLFSPQTATPHSSPQHALLPSHHLSLIPTLCCASHY